MKSIKNFKLELEFNDRDEKFLITKGRSLNIKVALKLKEMSWQEAMKATKIINDYIDEIYVKK